MATPISVISSAYCLPNSIKLKIDTGKGVTYINDEVVFRVQAPSITLHHRCSLCDASGNPLLTLYKKRMTVHGRWKVFKGGKTDSTDLLFSVKRSSLRIPHKKNVDLDVFLAKNTKGSAWDFKVNADADKKSCDICTRGPSTILAKMTNNRGIFEVDVQPNVDYAFIVALLTIVDQIDNLKSDKNNSHKTSRPAGGVALGVLEATTAVASLGQLWATQQMDNDNEKMDDDNEQMDNDNEKMDDDNEQMDDDDEN